MFSLSIYQLSGRAGRPLPVFPGCQLSGNLFALFFYHRKDNLSVFIPKRKPQFDSPLYHIHFPDQFHCLIPEIGIVIRVCFPYQEVANSLMAFFCRSHSIS